MESDLREKTHLLDGTKQRERSHLEITKPSRDPALLACWGFNGGADKTRYIERDPQVLGWRYFCHNYFMF